MLGWALVAAWAAVAAAAWKEYEPAWWIALMACIATCAVAGVC